MSDGVGAFLFGATSETEQAELERQVSVILSSLEQVAKGPDPVTVGLTSQGVDLITWLMDLGAAPDRFEVSRTIKLIGRGRPAVMLVIAPNVAEEMRSMVERGAFRHRAGATDPDAIRVH